jgi:hypothetical protein
MASALPLRCGEDGPRGSPPSRTHKKLWLRIQQDAQVKDGKEVQSYQSEIWQLASRLACQL